MVGESLHSSRDAPHSSPTPCTSERNVMQRKDRQRRRFLRRVLSRPTRPTKSTPARGLALLGGFAAVVVAVGVGSAAVSAPDGTITACIKTKDDGVPKGSLRVVDTAAECKTNEQALSWNKQGPGRPRRPTRPGWSYLVRRRTRPRRCEGRRRPTRPEGRRGSSGAEGRRRSRRRRRRAGRGNAYRARGNRVHAHRRDPPEPSTSSRATRSR